MTSARTAHHLTPQDFLAALESLDDLIVSVDRELRIVSWNAAAERLLDRPSADVAGVPLLTLLAPRVRQDAAALLDRVLHGETIRRQELAMLRRDGAEVPVSVAFAPVGGAAGTAAGALLLGHDVGAQQRLQLQLLQSKRMESTGQLAGGVAHEFNNILTAILALADFTARALPPDSPAREDVDEIREQATKGARLVRHLLAFSRRQLLRKEVVHLGSIFTELEPLLQRLVSERILIATDAALDTRAVEIDRAQMELVLLELVSNASDAMEEGGTLSIDIRPTTIANHPTLKAGEYVQVTFQDSGIGFDVTQESRIFNPFFTTKGEDHAGLGLSMVEGVVQQHGGAVSIDSAPGRGTTVTLLLPAAAEVPAEAGQYTPGKQKEANETILVVEDETAVRNIVCRALRDRGYEVLEAKNGEDALLVAEQHSAPIHLVVTDVVMPEMGGAELFHNLRRWYPTMRILFISGYTKGSLPPEALEAGMGGGFLAKPFTLEQLVMEVRRMIEAPRNAPQSAGV
ncbi:MAG TPA: response regulator [Gemmatimonadaceae bacterium]|nr:response regulator [Gemmatimonadaceae bacterium]